MHFLSKIIINFSIIEAGEHIKLKKTYFFNILLYTSNLFLYQNLTTIAIESSQGPVKGGHNMHVLFYV